VIHYHPYLAYICIVNIVSYYVRGTTVSQFHPFFYQTWSVVLDHTVRPHRPTMLPLAARAPSHVALELGPLVSDPIQ
jgi:hypothetical protein